MESDSVMVSGGIPGQVRGGVRPIDGGTGKGGAQAVTVSAILAIAFTLVNILVPILTHSFYTYSEDSVRFVFLIFEVTSLLGLLAPGLASFAFFRKRTALTITALVVAIVGNTLLVVPWL